MWRAYGSFSPLFSGGHVVVRGIGTACPVQFGSHTIERFGSDGSSWKMLLLCFGTVSWNGSFRFQFWLLEQLFRQFRFCSWFLLMVLFSSSGSVLDPAIRVPDPSRADPFNMCPTQQTATWKHWFSLGCVAARCDLPRYVVNVLLAADSSPHIFSWNARVDHLPSKAFLRREGPQKPTRRFVWASLDTWLKEMERNPVHALQSGVEKSLTIQIICGSWTRSANHVPPLSQQFNRKRYMLVVPNKGSHTLIWTTSNPSQRYTYMRANRAR